MEHQQVEWKESWRDEYLKWICGFANAQGGVLHIGRSDRGEVTGVSDAEKLLTDLPNKIRQSMGIVANVNLYHEGDLAYITIEVGAYPNAISYRGKYYLRSGSTNQELSGYSLDALILGKYGKTWDSIPVPHVKLSDFDGDAFRAFRRKAIGSARMTAEDLEITYEMLLENLRVTEGAYFATGGGADVSPRSRTLVSRRVCEDRLF